MHIIKKLLFSLFIIFYAGYAFGGTIQGMVTDASTGVSGVTKVRQMDTKGQSSGRVFKINKKPMQIT